jgi:aldehyde dehydrogenase
MQLSEDLIRSVVHQVLTQIGTSAPTAATPVVNGTPAIPPVTGIDGVFAAVDPAVSAARAAFDQFRKRGLDARRKAIAEIKRICFEQADELGRAELEETKIGRLDHKIAKLRDAIPPLPGVEFLETQAVTGDNGMTLTERAPFGVIAAITPVTHSLPTLASNAISMLAAGNTVVFNAHPAGARIAAEGVRRFNRAIRAATGLENLLAIVDPPTLESAQALFEHREIKLIVVTGGPAVARAALRSHKRAIVAGPGNPPVVVDATACLENAAKSIVLGAAWDNNLLCIGEKQLFAVAEIFDKLMEALGRHGGFRLQPAQIDALTRVAFKPNEHGKPHLNKDLVGKDPQVLAQFAGVSIPQGTQLLFGETAADHPFVLEEQMMPFLPCVRVASVDRAIELAKQTEHGYGHTAILHSRDMDVIQKMGRVMECSIFVVNGPCVAGLGAGGEGYGSFSIAGPTGEGVTTPLTFTRERRLSVAKGMRIL